MRPQPLSLVAQFVACFTVSVWAGGPGLPSRDPGLDVAPGFRQPPPGYGEVPFWWWTGDRLDSTRLVTQLDALHSKGISGVQVNYSHYDTPGWLTDHDEPAIFTEAWWTVYQEVAKACADRQMGIGLSTYTLDWPRGASNLFYGLFYRVPEWNALQLEKSGPWRLSTNARFEQTLPADTFSVRAYRVKGQTCTQGGTDLTSHIENGRLVWQAPEGEWEIWAFRASSKPGSFNPLMAGSGQTIIKGFFQPFEDRAPARSSKGLNYFFNDELHIGVEKFAWNPDFPQEFRTRKGYDLMEVLPAMWEDIGAVTPKVRMDYADVRMSLMEERYFRPIYDWHARRGMIFGCDSGGRGLDPHEFGDYFRATRWYSAPGHDTPGGKADLIKGKVSSSIANLYQRPRVWLEGYHSLGWGATPELLMFATRENYLYGCTLLNLHGLYYTTYGSHWEWAPPCYHFRMPYWDHMNVFLGYFERLSYLMSQGHTVSDVALLYPVAPYEAELDGNNARDTAFALARQLMAAGISFEFIDNDSLARAVVEDRFLKVKSASAAYQALVFPAMSAVRWPSIEKAAEFAVAGGAVYAVGSLPFASDRAGRDDPELAKMNERTFLTTNRLQRPEEAVQAIGRRFVQDVRGIDQPVRALHRKAGFRDIYMVMDAKPGTIVEFRAKGAVELWDPWTGGMTPLRVVSETPTGTQVELPLEAYEANLVVFTPGQPHVSPPPRDTRPERERPLPDEWSVTFVPTMDNSHGDFRMPVTDQNKRIGLEARNFSWAKETGALAELGMLPQTDDRQWGTKLNGFGTQFFILGPVPAENHSALLETALAGLRRVDAATPVHVGGQNLYWRAYDFSWRYGKEGDPGHQGYHGLKRTITDDFLCLGKPVGALNETRHVEELKGGRYYVWTCATVEAPISVDVVTSSQPPADKSHTSPVLTPAKLYINGTSVAPTAHGITLNAGANPVLVRYDQAGRGHFVLRRTGAAPRNGDHPLAMRWFGDDGVLPFDVSAGSCPAEWFRFTTAPGTTAIQVRAHGAVKAWLDGTPMEADTNGRFIASRVPKSAAVIAMRVSPARSGVTGGGLIPDPVIVETGTNGQLRLGDWSKVGILNNYSGGVRYRTVLTLKPEEAEAKSTLDLGVVSGTAEVVVNGRKAGVRVAPPWRQDVTGLLRPGENSVEVLVYNTLANHYQTVPTRYRGNPTSGLLGPVRLVSREWAH